MRLDEWIAVRGGIAHREEAAAAGFPPAVQRAAVRSGAVLGIRRSWLALAGAPADLVAAAAASARLACVSVARRRGWWLPPAVSPGLHLAAAPTSSTPRPPGAVVHWTRPVAPAGRWSLEESVEDALAHIARCLDRESALVLWEAAVRTERLSTDAVRRVAWATPAARECAASVRGLSDSGLETIFVFRLRHLRVSIRQQAVLAGRPVDALIGDRLVVQIDGWEHHSTSAQRGKDVVHDAELRLRGYTVLRFTYAQIVHDWPSVERTIARAIAAGLHLAE